MTIEQTIRDVIAANPDADFNTVCDLAMQEDGYYVSPAEVRITLKVILAEDDD